MATHETHPATATESMDVLGEVLAIVLPPKLRTGRRRSAAAPPPPSDTFLASSIEMATRLRREPDPIQFAFRRCVACLHDVHRAYRFATDSLVPPLAAGDLGVIAFFITHAAGRWQPTLSVYSISGNMDSWVARELNDANQAEAMHVMLRRFREGDAFALASERRSRSRAALERGEFDAAVVDAAVASEVLLDAVLGYTLWEDGVATTDAAELLVSRASSSLKKSCE